MFCFIFSWIKTWFQKSAYVQKPHCSYTKLYRRFRPEQNTCPEQRVLEIQSFSLHLIRIQLFKRFNLDQIDLGLEVFCYPGPGNPSDFCAGLSKQNWIGSPWSRYTLSDFQIWITSALEPDVLMERKWDGEETAYVLHCIYTNNCFWLQGFFIRHILNYTGYNQKWNVKDFTFPHTAPYLRIVPM